VPRKGGKDAEKTESLGEISARKEGGKDLSIRKAAEMDHSKYFPERLGRRGM